MHAALPRRLLVVLFLSKLVARWLPIDVTSAPGKFPHKQGSWTSCRGFI